MVLTAASMVVLLSFAALAVDSGYLYLRRAQIQDVADSAALAAAGEMLVSRSSDDLTRQAAFDAVVRYASLNGLAVAGGSGFAADVEQAGEPGTLAVAFPGDMCEVQVDINLDARTFFARALSLGSMGISVRSTAEVIHMDGEDGGLLPLGFFGPDCVPGVLYSVTYAPGDGVQGNYGFLDYKPPCSFREYLTDGYNGTVSIGDVVETFPGVRVGQVRAAINDRINDCVHGCYVEDPDGVNDGADTVVHITEPCHRVVVAPKIAGFEEACGRSYVTVVGFVKLFIEDYNQSTKVLTAWCLGEVSPDEENLTAADACGVRLVK